MRSLFMTLSFLTLTCSLGVLTACSDGSGTTGAGGSTTGGGGAGGSGGGAEPTIDCSGDNILHYNFQNQIFGSKLDVSKAGVVSRVEHGCCPPKDDTMADPALSAAELTELLARIEAASQGPVHVESGSPTAEGSLSGTLQVCTAAKEGVIIRDVARNDNVSMTGNDIVTVNDAPEAKQIRAFVEAIVEADM